MEDSIIGEVQGPMPPEPWEKVHGKPESGIRKLWVRLKHSRYLADVLLNELSMKISGTVSFDSTLNIVCPEVTTFEYNHMALLLLVNLQTVGMFVDCLVASRKCIGGWIVLLVNN